MLMSMNTGSGARDDPRLAWDRGWARWALQRWASFPVDHRPRPLVLTAPLTRFERGFRSGDAKLAFHYGDIEPAVPLPDGLLDLLRGSGSERGPRAEPRQRRWKSPLLITQASRGQAEFATDRGRREFPAWRLGGPEIGGALWALDPKVASGCWAPPEPGPPKPFDGLPHRGASAVIDGDGLTLHFTFTGAPPGDAEYPAAEAIETDQALVVLPTAQNAGPPGWRTAIGCARTVITRLTRPLGERVVIDLDASPVMVLPHDPA